LLLDPFVTVHAMVPLAARPYASYVSAAPAVASAKGAFVIHMLRCLMFDQQTRDQDFMAMLRDFTSAFANRTASTENFKRVVEAHIKPAMDLDHNGRMDWFFNDWVYGCEIPSYRLEYWIEKSNGRAMASGRLAQSGVSPGFRMRVPIYAEFGGMADVVGSVALTGSMGAEFRVELPAAPDRLALNANFDVLTDRQEVQAVSK
jgi:hypothetical protein